MRVQKRYGIKHFPRILFVNLIPKTRNPLFLVDFVKPVKFEVHKLIKQSQFTM